MDALDPDDPISISIAHQMLDAPSSATGDRRSRVEGGRASARAARPGALGLRGDVRVDGPRRHHPAASRFIRLVNDALDIRVKTKGDAWSRPGQLVPMSRAAADFQNGRAVTVLNSIWGSAYDANVPSCSRTEPAGHDGGG